jgi:nitrogen regulatory protein P-II 1
MKKVEAIVRPERITIVKQRLQQLGIGGMTILDATGWSKQRELHLQWRGQDIAYDLIPRLKIEVVIPDPLLNDVIKSISESAKTDEGEHGDGVIFVFTVEEAINIATSARGEKVLR